jgi:hypothetical protein
MNFQATHNRFFILKDGHFIQLSLVHEGFLKVPLYPGFYYGFLPSKEPTWEFYWQFPKHLKKEFYWTEISRREKKVRGNLFLFVSKYMLIGEHHGQSDD